MRQRFLGIPLGTQVFEVAGVEKVYYDTVDSWTMNAAPTAEPDTTSMSPSAIFLIVGQILKLLLIPIYGISTYITMIRLSGNSDASLFFEVGLLGPRARFSRLKRSRNSAEIRGIATWLSTALGVPIERRDRRSPE